MCVCVCVNSDDHHMQFLLCLATGWYDVPEGMVFSFPVTFSPKGYWIVVQDIDLAEEEKQKIQNIVKVGR